MNEDDNRLPEGMLCGCGYVLLFWAAMALLLCLTGCKTVERENIVTRADTVHMYSQRTDSVIHRDSVFHHIYTHGDTVYSITERWNVRYNDRLRIDTVYMSKEAQMQSKEVEEKLEPWWKEFTAWLFAELSVVLLCLFLIIRERKA